MAHVTDQVLKWWTLALVIFLSIVSMAFIFETQRDSVYGFLNNRVAEKSTIPVGPYYKVTRVVDGDTLVVNINGVDEKIRLIGINTPETVDSRKTIECFGKEATKRMEELADGELVRLESDDSQGTRDVYGRLLGYVYLQDGQMLNRKMVAEGYANEYTYMTPYKYQQDFRDVQNIARISERGLWSPETCNGKK